MYNYQCNYFIHLFCFLDFQKFVFTSLTHFKYDISAMMHIVKDTNENSKALISKSNNNNFISTVSPHKLVWI